MDYRINVSHSDSDPEPATRNSQLLFMTHKIDLRNLTFEELRDWTANLGLESYRAEQVFRWIFQPDIQSFDQMTNLSKKWRDLFQAAGLFEPVDR